MKLLDNNDNEFAFDTCALLMNYIINIRINIKDGGQQVILAVMILLERVRP